MTGARVTRRWCVGLASLLLLVGTARSHEMGFEVLAGDGYLQGRLHYSDESSAAQEFIRIVNLTDTGFAPVVVQTGDDGVFRVAGMPGHRYALTATGDEGHSMTVEAEVPPPAGLPVFGWVAILLLLSMLPAWWLQRRQPEERAPGLS